MVVPFPKHTRGRKVARGVGAHAVTNQGSREFDDVLRVLSSIPAWDRVMAWKIVSVWARLPKAGDLSLPKMPRTRALDVMAQLGVRLPAIAPIPAAPTQVAMAVHRGGGPHGRSVFSAANWCGIYWRGERTSQHCNWSKQQQLGMHMLFRHATSHNILHCTCMPEAANYQIRSSKLRSKSTRNTRMISSANTVPLHLSTVA